MLISEYTYGKVCSEIEVGEANQVRVKGKSELIELYEVVACNWRQRLEVPRREIRTSPRVEVDMPFRFQCLAGKIVLEPEREARMKDIGYYGLYAIMVEEIESMTDIKLSISLSLLGGEVRDIYAKVTSVRRINGVYGCGIEFTSVDEESRKSVKEFVDRILESD